MNTHTSCVGFGGDGQESTGPLCPAALLSLHLYVPFPHTHTQADTWTFVPTTVEAFTMSLLNPLFKEKAGIQ